MSNTWEYAEHVKKVHYYGGPRAYVSAVRQQAFDTGYATGKAEGQRIGALYMLPFVIGTGYLLYEKAPGIWKKIKDKVRVVQKQAEKTVGTEKQETKKKVDVLCPQCLETVVSVDDTPEWYYRERYRHKDTMRQATCPQCGKKVQY